MNPTLRARLIEFAIGLAAAILVPVVEAMVRFETATLDNPRTWLLGIATAVTVSLGLYLRTAIAKYLVEKAWAKRELVTDSSWPAHLSTWTDEARWWPNWGEGREGMLTRERENEIRQANVGLHGHPPLIAGISLQPATLIPDVNDNEPTDDLPWEELEANETWSTGG